MDKTEFKGDFKSRLQLHYIPGDQLIGGHIPQPLLHQLWSTGWNDEHIDGQDKV